MSSRTELTFTPPVMEVGSWIDGKDFSKLPLLNVSQAAPVAPPPRPLIEYMAEAIQEDSTHLYGPVLGLPELRSEISKQWSRAYGDTITVSYTHLTLPTMLMV